MPEEPHAAADDARWSDAIERYHAGEASPAQAAECQRYLEAHPGIARFYEELWRRLDAASVAASSLDPEGSLERLHQRMARGTSSSDSAQREVRRTRPVPAALGGMMGERERRARPGQWRAFAAAAVVLIVAGVAGGRWAFMRQPDAAPNVVRSDGWLREYATQRGQRANIRLADGSQVVLNAASRLRIPVGYGERERTVHLEGQAKFTVRHDAARPFVVRTEGTITEDLGTVFDIRAYPGAGTTRVVVVEGKVGLRALPVATAYATPDSGSRTSPTTVSAGQLATVTRAGATSVVTNARLDQFIAWSEGRLVFQRTPLPEAVEELARWYDLDVRFTDRTLDRLLVSASFKDEPLDEVLEALSASLGAQYERRGRIITLSRKPVLR